MAPFRQRSMLRGPINDTMVLLAFKGAQVSKDFTVHNKIDILNPGSAWFLELSMFLPMAPWGLGPFTEEGTRQTGGCVARDTKNH